MNDDLLDREQVAVVVDLESPDEEIRRLAVERLLTLPAAAAVPRLVEGLGDPSWRVRKAAVERLVACPNSELVVEALIAALADGENPGRRNAAVEALVHSGRGVVPWLIETLGSPDVDVRKLAIDAIAGIGDESARDALLPVLRDSDSNVRAAAADAVGVIGGPEMSDRLGELALDTQEDPLVRLSALRGLVRMEVPVSATKFESVLDQAVLRPAVYTLLGRSPEDGALDMLLKGLACGSRAAREAAMTSVLQRLSAVDGSDAEAVVARVREAALGSEALLPQIFERLREADLPTRLVLVQFLGLVASPACTLPILEAGRDEALAEIVRATLHSFREVAESAIDAAWNDLDATLRSEACAILAKGSSPRSVSRLREALVSSDCSLRSAAARALGERRCAEALGGLVAGLEHVDEDDPDCEEERDALIEALASLGRAAPEGAGLAEEAIDLMALRLEGASVSMRHSIAALLAEIGTPSSDRDMELLSVLLRDPDPLVRRSAVQTLARLEPGRARESLRLTLADESPIVRSAAAVALGASDEDGVLQDLCGLLQDEDARSRAAAVRALGEHCARVPADAETGIELISKALGEHGLVAIAGIEALDRVGGDSAARAACAVLSRPEPELVQAAAQCIGRHGSAGTLAELLPLVPHESWMVRAEAIQILGERRVRQAVPAILRSLESEQHDFVREMILGALKRLEE